MGWLTPKRMLIALGVLFALPFLYALLSERTTTALLPLRFTLLGLMPIMSVLCLAAALRWERKSQANLFLLICSVAIAIVLVEILFPVIQQVGTRSRIQALAGEDFDERDKLQVVQDLQAAGTQAVPSIEPKGLLAPASESPRRSRLSDEGRELHPVGGIALRRTVVCNETGSWVVYDSDRFGMNNPDAVWDDTELDVAVVGDSFTNGWCSRTEDHYAFRIRSRYPRTVNLGQSGNGPLLILASILEYLPGLRPANVVWFHYEGNDFWDLDAELMSPLLLRYLQTGATQDLANRQAAIDREIHGYVNTAVDQWRDEGNLVVTGFDASFDIASIKRVVKLTRFRSFFGLNFTGDFSPDYTTLGSILAASNRAVEGWGGRLWFVYLPVSTRYLAVAGADGRWETDRTRVTGQVRELGIPIIDVHELFAEQGRPLSFYNPIRDGGYGHFTDEGNRIVAAAVLAALAAGNER